MLKTRNLTREQWKIIRALLGKPRLFSFAFLKNEKSVNKEKRRNLSYLQAVAEYQSINSLAHLEVKSAFLPKNALIPKRFPLETKVLVHLLHMGLYEGSIQSEFSTRGRAYKVRFDDPVEEDPHGLPVMVQATNDKKLAELEKFTGHVYVSENLIFTDANKLAYFTVNSLVDTLKSNKENVSPSNLDVKLISAVQTMSRLVHTKHGFVDQLKRFNDRFETSEESIDQEAYARLVLDLSDLNSRLREVSDTVTFLVSQYHERVLGMPSISNTCDWRRKSADEAFEIISNNNQDSNKSQLIVKLGSLLTLISRFQEMLVIEDLLQDIRKELMTCNIRTFEAHVVPYITEILNSLFPGWEQVRQHVYPNNSIPIVPSDSATVRRSNQPANFSFN
ncbi:Protein lin-9 [Cichlidogyrus casuarinus]|uniref:Protein lin-9 n=1 Tax=Cichlidogyrus casuarinus TaxID=1844966 RepID=A0ABD2Q5J9_9PLAT